MFSPSRNGRTLFLLTLCAGAAYGQPFIFYRGIFNSASFAPQGLPNGAIARGSLFSILGRNLGPAQGTSNSAYPLGTTFQGVSVSVCQNGACVPAFPQYVSAGVVNAIMPSNAPLGPVSIRVFFNGQGGYYASATVVAASFSVFAANSGGFGPGIVQNFTPESVTLNSSTASAKPGQTVIVWGTGLGAGLNADNLAPQVGDLPVAVEIWAGGKKVTVKRYSGRSPSYAGVDVLIFDLPADTPAGCYVPIQVRAGGQTVSNSVSLAVSADGGPCSDPFNPLSQIFRKGGKLGLVMANRVNATQLVDGVDQEETVEFALGSFRKENGGAFAYNALASLPPPGACTVHTVPGDFLSGSVIPAFKSSGGELDAGTSLSFGNLQVPGPAAPDFLYYSGTLAGTPAGFRRLNGAVSVLNSPMTLRVPGGADVGAFSVDLPAAPAIQWTNRNQGNDVDRATGFRVDWQGGDAFGGVVLVAGISTDTATNASAVFVCTAPSGSKTFSVPSYIVQALPPSSERPLLGLRPGYAMVGFLPLNAGGAVSTSGLDAVLALVTSWSARAVYY